MAREACHRGFVLVGGSSTSDDPTVHLRLMAPASAGEKDKNPVGSSHYGTPNIAPRRLDRNGVLCRKLHGAGRNGRTNPRHMHRLAHCVARWRSPLPSGVTPATSARTATWCARATPACSPRWARARRTSQRRSQRRGARWGWSGRGIGSAGADRCWRIKRRVRRDAERAEKTLLIRAGGRVGHMRRAATGRAAVSFRPAIYRGFDRISLRTLRLGCLCV